MFLSQQTLSSFNHTKSDFRPRESKSEYLILVNSLRSLRSLLSASFIIDDGTFPPLFNLHAKF